MSVKKLGLAVAGAVTVGAFALGGVALAAAAAPSTPPTPGASAAPGDAVPSLTGDEFDSVVAAIKAKDAAVTVAGVIEGPDGAYRVLGTKDGERIGYRVSADLKTITEGGLGRGHGAGHGPGRGGSPVAGDELAKVTAAVQGKDAAVTVMRVHKGADGAYHVFGTKAGERVGFEVSADLKTVTERAGRGHRGGMPAPGPTS